MVDHPTASAAVVDAIERICFDMVMIPNGRGDGTKKLKFFVNMIENRKQIVQFGRLSILMGMAGIAAWCSSATIDEDPKNWVDFLERFEDCRDRMVRQDATVVVPLRLKNSMYDGMQVDHEVVENPDTNNELDSSPIFQQQYFDAIKVCQLQQVLSVIRPCILGDEDTDESTAAEALDLIKRNFRDDDSYRNYLLSFFEKAESGKTLPELKPFEELREILDSRKDLSVARCIKKCDQLIQSMCQALYGENAPTPLLPESTRKNQRRRSATVKRPLPEGEDVDLPSLGVKKSSRKRIFTSRFSEEYGNVGSTKSTVSKKIKKSNSTKSTPVRKLQGLDLENSPTPRKKKPIQRYGAEYGGFGTEKTLEFPSEDEVEKEIEEERSMKKAAVQNNDDDEGGQSDGDESGDESGDENKAENEVENKNKDDNASFVGNDDDDDDSDDDVSDPGPESEKKGDSEDRLIEKYLETKAAGTPAASEAEGTAGRQKPHAKRPVLATPEPLESFEQPTPDEKFPPKKKRVKWTEKETNAVKVGVRKYGEGNWVQVKDMFPDILAKRTNVNIKDKWRILTKNGATW